MGPEGALSSDEVNFLVYRYLLEAGFTHSAFVFGCESTVNNVNVNGKDVPIGALVSFIQKGFQFMELEANLNEQGTDVYGKYCSMTANDILTKDIRELRELAREMKVAEAREKRGQDGAHPAADATVQGGREEPHAAPSQSVPSSAAQELGDGHGAEILSISYSPAVGKLAACAADGAVRIWTIPGGSSSSTRIRHEQQQQCDSIDCEVTSSGDDDVIIGVEWAPDGQLLAGITATGRLLLWNGTGQITHTIPSSGASILAAQWSQKGRYIAAGGADGSIAVYSISSTTGPTHTEQWTLPNGGAPVYDLHWRDDTELAAAGEDGTIAVFTVGSALPNLYIKEGGEADDDAGSDVHMNGGGTGSGTGTGERALHEGLNPDTVTMVRWDASGALASGSNSMKVGFLFSGGALPVFEKKHKREVTWVSWAPTAPIPTLASGSADGCVWIWEASAAEEGIRCRPLDNHLGGLTCGAWAPTSPLRLAVGDDEGNITVWSVQDNIELQRYRDPTDAAVIDVQWADDRTLAVQYANKTSVTLLDQA